MDNFKELMKRYGLTDSQMNSKTYKAAEEIVAKETGEFPLVGLADEVNNALDRADNTINRLAEYSKSIEKTKGILAKEEEYYNEAIKEMRGRTIQDPIVRDAFCLFQNMLVSVRDVFGEDKMSEAVICKALESSSYGLWRSIMGESKPVSSTTKIKNVY